MRWSAPAAAFGSRGAFSGRFRQMSDMKTTCLSVCATALLLASTGLVRVAHSSLAADATSALETPLPGSFFRLSGRVVPIRPLVSLVGADTRIARTECLRLTSKEAWIRLWVEHEGRGGWLENGDEGRSSGAPDIDFEQCMVIAITEAGTPNTGIVASSITETAQEVTFDYDTAPYPSRREGTSAPGNAYGFFVLPRSVKGVVVRHNVQDSASRTQGEPPVWKEVKRFEALEPSPFWTSSEVAAADSVEGQLRSQGKHWVRTPGEITVGAYVQDILEGRLDQPKGRGAIGRVTSVSTGDHGAPLAIVDFGRGYSPGINLSELSLVNFVAE